MPNQPINPITKEKMTMDLVRERAAKTAMASPEHLKAWLDQSGRRWLVFDGRELVDALPWPGGVQELMDLVYLYNQHRCSKPSGRTEVLYDPITKEEVTVPVFKGEILEKEELDRAIRYLVAQLLAIDPEWNLERPAL